MKKELKEQLFEKAWEENKSEYLISLEDAYAIIDQLDEPEKPVIPKYVAEQLEYWKRNKMNILWQFWLREIPSSMLWWLEGDEGNYDKLLDAEKNGYEVEKEKKYYVKIQSQFLCVGKYNKDFIALQYHEDINDAEKCEFTEQEIKDYDPRYWAFAQEVTE